MPSTHQEDNPLTPVCLPLLKFDADAPGDLLLCSSALEKLAALSAPVHVVTVIGDSRCGKSTLASRLIASDTFVFPVGDTGASVTHGIDMCIRPLPGGSEGSLVVLDCQGCSDPAGSINGAVDLISMFTSSLTVQVVLGHVSESHLGQIAEGIAQCDRLDDNALMLPEWSVQSLLMVVSCCHLTYDSDFLHRTLAEVHTRSDPARDEVRNNIRRMYKQIDFVTIPRLGDASYSSQLDKFKHIVYKRCDSECPNDSSLSGAQVAARLTFITNKLRAASSVPAPSVFRHALFDNLLRPLVDRLVNAFEITLPDMSDGEFRCSLADKRNTVLQLFDCETQSLSNPELVAEARKDLQTRIDAVWQEVLEQNEAVGKQNCVTSPEVQMRHSHTEDRAIALKQLLQWRCFACTASQTVVKQCKICKPWARTWVLKKNGQIACSDWLCSGQNSSASSFKYSSSSMSVVPPSEEDCGGLGSATFDLQTSRRQMGLAEVLRRMSDDGLSFDEARHQMVLNQMKQFGIDASGTPLDAKLVTFSSAPSKIMNQT